ncbi:hypothetical protein HDZ31DRAFT_47728 [Schizophyllum fasciatum]
MHSELARTRAGPLATTRSPLLVLRQEWEAVTDDKLLYSSLASHGMGSGMTGGSKSTRRALLLTIMATDSVDRYELAVADLRMHLDDVARHRRTVETVAHDQHAIARVRVLDRRLYDTRLPGAAFKQFSDTARPASIPLAHTSPALAPATGTPAPIHAPSPSPTRAPPPPPPPPPASSPAPAPAPPLSHRPHSSAESSEATEIQALLEGNLWQSPLSTAQIAQLASLSSTPLKRRRVALANAVRGVAHDITRNSWKEVFAGSADSEDLFALQQQSLAGHWQSIGALAQQHNGTCNCHRFMGEFALVNKMLLKLFDVTLARRWYAASTHDSQFATRFYRQLWAETDEGRAALASGPAEQVFKDRKKDISKFARAQQAHVTARNRLLRLSARFGPIVLLDPCWEYDILLSTTNGPKAMNTALAYYEAFASQAGLKTRQTMYLRAEEAVIALTAAFFWHRPEYVDIVRGQLWELRVHAAVAFT